MRPLRSRCPHRSPCPCLQQYAEFCLEALRQRKRNAAATLEILQILDTFLEQGEFCSEAALQIINLLQLQGGPPGPPGVGCMVHGSVVAGHVAGGHRGGGYCRLQMPLSLAPAVRGTVAGVGWAPWRGGEGG